MEPYEQPGLTPEQRVDLVLGTFPGLGTSHDLGVLKDRLLRAFRDVVTITVKEVPTATVEEVPTSVFQGHDLEDK